MPFAILISITPIKIGITDMKYGDFLTAIRKNKIELVEKASFYGQELFKDYR